MTRLLVLGLGPAASAAAFAARAAGADVTLIGREPPPGPRFGETLPPRAGPLIHHLGIDLSADGHMSAPGTTAVWADPEPTENDFIFSPHGPGWHLDRAAFDARLRRSAEERGARIVTGARLRTFRRASDGWVVTAFRGDEPIEVRADFVLDATGRSGWFVRRLGIAREVHDQLIGVVGFFEDAAGDDARTVLEATRDGWWYGARLPEQRSVVAYMTDADLAAAHPGGPLALWHEQFRVAPFVTAVAGQRLTALRVVSANSSRLTQVAGPGWSAVGDAAASWDPLSSQGIVTALEGGWRAGCVAAAPQGGCESLADYSAWTDAVWASYLQQYRAYYGQVRRWPSSHFWNRRQHSATLAPAR